MLSDRNILELQGEMELIYPFHHDHLQPCSYDVRLSGDLKTVRGKQISLKHDDYVLKPNEFILGSTIEKVKLPSTVLTLIILLPLIVIICNPPYQ